MVDWGLTDKGLESEKHVARLSTNVHETSSGEATDGEESLCNGVEVGALVVAFSDAEIGARLSEVVDKVGFTSRVSCCSDRYRM